MKTSWRWFGSNDPVSLKMIRQTGVTDLVHALSVPAGEVWTKEELVNRNQEIEKNGLAWKVIESLPWTAEMLLGDSKRDQHLENYLLSLSNIQQSWKSKEPPVILYNLMLWADWYRTSFAKELENGKVVAEFVVDKMEELARPENIRAAIEAMANMRGWNSVYTVDVALELLGRCQTLTEAKLWDNVTYCLKEIIPTAQKLGLRLAVHPDDPPRSIFGNMMLSKQTMFNIIGDTDIEIRIEFHCCFFKTLIYFLFYCDIIF